MRLNRVNRYGSLQLFSQFKLSMKSVDLSVPVVFQPGSFINCSLVYSDFPKITRVNSLHFVYPTIARGYLINKDSIKIKFSFNFSASKWANLEYWDETCNRGQNVPRMNSKSDIMRWIVSIDFLDKGPKWCVSILDNRPWRWIHKSHKVEIQFHSSYHSETFVVITIKEILFKKAENEIDFEILSITWQWTSTIFMRPPFEDLILELMEKRIIDLIWWRERYVRYGLSGCLLSTVCTVYLSLSTHSSYILLILGGAFYMDVVLMSCANFGCCPDVQTLVFAKLKEWINLE